MPTRLKLQIRIKSSQKTQLPPTSDSSEPNAWKKKNSRVTVSSDYEYKTTELASKLINTNTRSVLEDGGLCFDCRGDVLGMRRPDKYRQILL